MGAFAWLRRAVRRSSPPEPSSAADGLSAARHRSATPDSLAPYPRPAHAGPAVRGLALAATVAVTAGLAALLSPAPAHSAETCVPDALVSDIEGYLQSTHNGQGNPRPQIYYDRWNRVLAAFTGGEKGSGSPMTATEAQGYLDRNWLRWKPVVPALRCIETPPLEAQQDDQKLPDQPSRQVETQQNTVTVDLQAGANKVTEGNSGSQDVSVTVSVPTSHTQIFNYYLCFGGDATLDENGVYLSGEDYRLVAPSGAGVKIIWGDFFGFRCATSAIGSGGGSEVWRVRVYGDKDSEKDETVAVHLYNFDAGTTVTNSPQTIMIENDDLAANRLWLSKTASSADEADTQHDDYTFSVQADAGEAVHYVLCLSGTAEYSPSAHASNRRDWILLADGRVLTSTELKSKPCPRGQSGYKGSLTASDRKDDFSVRVYGDASAESDETVIIKLVEDGDAPLPDTFDITPKRAVFTHTIEDNDREITLSLPNGKAVETDWGDAAVSRDVVVTRNTGGLAVDYDICFGGDATLKKNRFTSRKQSDAFDYLVGPPSGVSYTVSNWDGNCLRGIALTGSSHTWEVDIFGDDRGEGDEEIEITLSSDDTSVTGSPQTLTIEDNDILPVVSIAGGAAVTEGANAVFTLTASPVPTASIAVTVSVADSGDFATTGQTGARTVSIGTSGTASLTVGTENDSADEADGTITATLQTGSRYTLHDTDTSASVAVNDNDDPPIPVVSVTGGAAVTEGASAVFTLTASPPPAADITVHYTILDSGDFASLNATGPKTVTIGTSGTATVNVSTDDDETDEPDGTIKLTVNTNNTDGGYVPHGSDASASVAVRDNDNKLVALSVASSAGNEGNTGHKDINVKVSKPAGSVTVVYDLCFNGSATLDRDGTKDAGEDYRVIAPGGTVQTGWTGGEGGARCIAARSLASDSDTWKIRVFGDTEVEGDETVVVALLENADSANALPDDWAISPAGTPHTYTISNEDFAVTGLTLSVASAAGNEGNSNRYNVDVTVTKPAGSAAIDYELCFSGTATLDVGGNTNFAEDYQVLSRLAGHPRQTSWGSGERAGCVNAGGPVRLGTGSHTWKIRVFGDTAPERDETVVVTLRDSATDSPAAGSPHTYTIENDERSPTQAELMAHDAQGDASVPACAFPIEIKEGEDSSGVCRRGTQNAGQSATVRETLEWAISPDGWMFAWFGYPMDDDVVCASDIYGEIINGVQTEVCKADSLYGYGQFRIVEDDVNNVYLIHDRTQWQANIGRAVDTPEGGPWHLEADTAGAGWTGGYSDSVTRLRMEGSLKAVGLSDAFPASAFDCSAGPAYLKNIRGVNVDYDPVPNIRFSPPDIDLCSNRGLPVLRIVDMTVTEPANGRKRITIQIETDNPVTAPVTYRIRSRSGSARKGIDFAADPDGTQYTIKTGSKAAPAGPPAKNTQVFVYGGTRRVGGYQFTDPVESDENFFIEIHDVEGPATLGNSEATITIVDPAAPELRVEDRTLPEDGSVHPLRVNLSKPVSYNLTFKLRTVEGEGTAKDGGGCSSSSQVDYLHSDDDWDSLTRTLPAGQSHFDAPGFASGCSDTEHEGDEHYFAEVYDVQGGPVTVVKPRARITIKDDDPKPPPAFEVAVYPAGGANAPVKEITAAESSGAATLTIERTDGHPLPAGYSVEIETLGVPGVRGYATPGVDYTDVSRRARSNGASAVNVSIPILPDSIDEGKERFFLKIENPSHGAVKRGYSLITITITNDGPIPSAWLSRFGRTVAEQALDGISGRMAADRTPGMEGTIGGQALALADSEVPADSLDDSHGLGWSQPPQSHTMSAGELLLGSSFTLTGAKDASGGSMAFWGRAAQGRFDGREGGLRVDGEVTTGLLGADYARGDWLLGLALAQSGGEGGYRGEEDEGDIEASLTAAIPYASLKASERLKLWGAAGYGSGDVTVKREDDETNTADTSWTMAAAGARGDLLAPPADGSGGPALALTSDAMWQRMSSDRTHGMLSSESDTTRLRLALEGSYRVALEGGGELVPKLEVGARHDGGDAETGFGVELGGGLAWRDPALGLSLDVSGRTLVAHEDGDLKDRGFAAQLAFDPAPATQRGPSLGLRQELGGQAEGGLDALFQSDPLDDRTGSKAASRWSMDAAYGLPLFGGRYTGSPHVGFGLATDARDYSVGWRLTPEANGPDLSFGLKAIRRESDAEAPEHSVGFEVRATW